jgi:hypothetical protein
MSVHTHRNPTENLILPDPLLLKVITLTVILLLPKVQDCHQSHKCRSGNVRQDLLSPVMVLSTHLAHLVYHLDQRPCGLSLNLIRSPKTVSSSNMVV